MNTKFNVKRLSRMMRIAVGTVTTALVLGGCYAVPVGQDSQGNPYYVYTSAPVSPTKGRGTADVPTATPTGATHHSLSVKLYPINDLANQTGVLTGSVTNMMTGKGRFTFNYLGEMLVGEATRVDNDQRRGVASAYSPSGMFVRCEYQMSSAKLGAGTCTFSNNAMYQLHVGA